MCREGSRHKRGHISANGGYYRLIDVTRQKYIVRLSVIIKSTPVSVGYT